VKGFGGYLFKSDPLRIQIQREAQGAKVLGISAGRINSIKVPYPLDKKEQQKIADCLSSLDELLSAHNQKLDALKAHKKGLMQQLFPAEGETVPKFRFPEFQDAGDWEEVTFGKVIKINSGKGFKASEYSKKGIRLLQIENVGYGETKWNENTIFLPETYATEYPELVLRNGDIVLALNRPVTNDELKIARILKDDEPSILYQRVGKLEVIDKSLTVDFAFHICRQFIKEFVISKSIGSDQPFISLRDLYAQSILISLPTEQQKIASCLSSIDELITAQSQKIEALKAHKKGLMQQLFPTFGGDSIDAEDRAMQNAKVEVSA
jgi:type I restriction enzyme S subunit